MTVNISAKLSITIEKSRLYLIIYFLHEVTRPRFEPPSLEVPESDPPVEVCVVVDEVLEREVNVTIRTSDKTATGVNTLQIVVISV